MFRTDQFLPLTGGITTGNIIVNGTSPHANNKTSGGTFTGLTNLKATLPNFTGFGSNSYTEGFLIGMNGSADESNYLMIATHDNGNEPIYVRQYAGSTGYSGLKKNDGTENISHEITLMDANGNTKVTKLKITSTANAQGTSNTEAPLEIGDHESLHLEIDNNEIMAKATKDTVSTLNLNANGGLVSIGDGGMSTSGPLKGANTTITGTLEVSGVTSLSNTLSVTGTTTMTGKLTANGGIDTKAINNTTLTASGDVSSSGNLSVTGTSTLTGKVTAQGGIDVTGGNIAFTTNATNSTGIANYVTGRMATNDNWRIAGGATASDSGFLEIATNDNGNEPIYVRQYTGGGFASKTRELTLLDGSGNTNLPGNLTLKNSNGDVNGTITSLRANFTASNDAVGSSFNNPALTIGLETGVHLEIDQNEIQGKSSKTTIGDISLNADGGNVYIADNDGASGSLSVPHGNISTGGTLTADGNTTLNGTLAVTGVTTIGNTLNANGNVVIAKDKVLQIMGSKARTVVAIESYNNDGDNCYYIGGSNLTGLFGGDSYSTWHSYVTSGNVDTNLWPDPILSFTDRLYLMSDKQVYIETNIQGGYPDRKSFKFDTAGSLTVPSTIYAANYSGNWGGVVNQITTHDTDPNLTRWMLTYVDGYIRYITMSEMADKMKSTINSGIDMSSKAPMPTTSKVAGQVILISEPNFTLPSGGTWFVWFYRSRYDSDYQDGMNAYNPYVNDDPNQKVNGKLIWPGGTKFNALSGQNASNGFAWRIQ